MTNKEALKAWEKLYSEIDKENWFFVGTINPQMVELAIKALQERQGEWVPVSERLPKKTGYYFVTRKGFSIKNHVKRVGYDANSKRWSEGSIIAWQPLPEPYKEGGAK